VLAVGRWSRVLGTTPGHRVLGTSPGEWRRQVLATDGRTSAGGQAPLRGWQRTMPPRLDGQQGRAAGVADRRGRQQRGSREVNRAVRVASALVWNSYVTKWL